MTEEKDPSITNFVDQRSKDKGYDRGRRESDRTKCVMCDFLTNKSDNCFEIIKRTMKEETKKTDHRFEIFEERLQGYVGKWTLGIIIMICSLVLGGIGLWQIENISELNRSVIVIGIKQEGILSVLKELTPEHKKVMKHLDHNDQVN